jgi:hypothetical protein
MQHPSNAWVFRKVLNRENGRGHGLRAQLATTALLLELTRRYDENRVWVVMFSDNTSKPERGDSAGPSGRVTTLHLFPSCRENVSCKTQFTFTGLREVGFSYQ